jgi:hypothetical protein
MDELRRDLNAAFDNEQSELGNLAGTRNRLMRNALAARETRSGARLQLAAGIAAVVIAAIVIATFAYVRGGAHRSAPTIPAASPRASAPPTPLSRALSVDPSTPVILYHDPAKSDQIDGITWDGKQSGRIDWPVPLAAHNAAATLFATATQIYDRSGVVASGNFGAKYFAGTWADDEQSFCQLLPFDRLGAGGVPATLQLVTPGSAPRSVAQVGEIYEQAVTRVTACSVRGDRAVVVQGFGNSPSTAQDWVVQLSTGKILWTHQFDITQPITVVASPDGKYVAENAEGQPLATSTIYGSDGSVVAHLDAHIDGFSWDGSLAVTDPGAGVGPVKVIRWQAGAVIWSGPTGSAFYLAQFAPEPDGTTLAIGIRNPAHPQDPTNPGFLPVHFYLVASDGHVIAELNNIYW